jgi:hypothetical protein
MEVKLHTFLISVRFGDESTSRFDRFITPIMLDNCNISMFQGTVDCTHTVLAQQHTCRGAIQRNVRLEERKMVLSLIPWVWNATASVKYRIIYNSILARKSEKFSCIYLLAFPYWLSTYISFLSFPFAMGRQKAIATIFNAVPRRCSVITNSMAFVNIYLIVPLRPENKK